MEVTLPFFWPKQPITSFLSPRRSSVSVPMSSRKSSRVRRRTKVFSFDSQSDTKTSLFTDEDEFKLLNSYFEIKSSMNLTKNSQPTIDTPTLDRIDSTLGLKFSLTQIVDKLRRLRIKYHKLARTKSLIKTPHDRQIYEIGRKIWGKGKGSSSGEGVKENPETETPVEEDSRKEEVNLRNFPFLVNEFSQHFPENVVLIEGLMLMEEKNLRRMNEEWVLLQIEEVELKARKAALVQKQAKAVLEAAVSNRTH